MERTLRFFTVVGKLTSMFMDFICRWVLVLEIVARRWCIKYLLFSFFILTHQEFPPNFVWLVTAHHTFVLQKMCSVACVHFLPQHTTQFQNVFSQISFVCWNKLDVRLLRGFLNCWALSAGETTAEPLKGQLFSAMFLVSSNWDHF